jgi:carboxyl-terminal processing protease
MTFKGRTVAAFIVLAMFAGSILTLTVLNSSILAYDSSGQQRQSGTDSAGRLSESANISEQQLAKIKTVYRIIMEKYYQDVDADKIVDGAINGMLESLDDPYSVYMDKEQAKQFEESVIESSFTGIGAEVTLEDGVVTVVAPIKGSPADKAGLQAKDKILSVNGEKLDGLTINEAVAKIRGPKGTQAKLEILRPGLNQPIEIIVVRDEIDIETVYSEMLAGGIGKIEIRQFAQNTKDRFAEELKHLENSGMKALIIDVRNNPGGLLPVVVEIAEMFVPEGKIIAQFEDKSGVRQQQVSGGQGKPYPIAVLVNEGSASASEILAAALSESAGATIIGTKTFGKGVVQSTFDGEFGDGSSLKITIAKWLTPNGQYINGKGIEPDIAVELPEYFQITPLPKDKALRYDDTGNDVRTLQIILATLGLKPDRTDGYFSRQTEFSVKAFQRMHQLPVTGIVDKETANKLEGEILEVMLDPQNDTQLQKAIEVLK